MSTPRRPDPIAAAPPRPDGRVRSALDALAGLERELLEAGVPIPGEVERDACPVPRLAPRYATEELVRIAQELPSEPAHQREALVREIRRHLSALRLFDAVHLETALAGLGAVPREVFVPPEFAEFAYLPMSGDIGQGQTISHPHVVAAMVAAAELDDRSAVFDVGTGCGYQAAVLGAVTATVVSVEIVPELAMAAKRRLSRLGCANVSVASGDGVLLAAGLGPFDAVLVAAGASEPPPPLVDRLVDGGRLVMPIGPARGCEQLVVARRDGSRLVSRSLGPVRFVPLTGPFGRG